MIELHDMLIKLDKSMPDNFQISKILLTEYKPTSLFIPPKFNKKYVGATITYCLPENK